MTNIYDMHELLPARFRALPRDRTLVVIPFAPIEYHGDHLPLGTDFIFGGGIFREACAAFAEKHTDWNFVFLPVFPLGADTVPHGGSLSVNKSTIRDVAEQVCSQLIGYGFRYIALFSGHGGYGQVTALEEVSRKLVSKHSSKNVKVFSALTYLLARSAEPEFMEMLSSLLPQPLDDEDIRQLCYETHGGRVETSYILSVAPELMDETYIAAEGIEPGPGPVMSSVLDAAAAIIPGLSEHERKYGIRALAAAVTWFYGGAKKGYLGHPERASAEFGEAVRGTISPVFGELLAEVLLNGNIPRDGDNFYRALRFLGR